MHPSKKDKEHENKVESSSKNTSFDTEFPMNIGDYVTVKPDLSVGKNSYGGLGWISDATKHNQKTYYTVRHIEAQGRREETCVPLHHPTVCMPPQHQAQIDRTSQ